MLTPAAKSSNASNSKTKLPATAEAPLTAKNTSNSSTITRATAPLPFE